MRHARLALAALLAAWATAGRAEEPRGWVLGVIPQAPPVAMHQAWSPLVERLAARTGIPLRLKVYDDMARFEEDFLAGGPDLIFAHPAMVAEAHQRQGYEPMIRDRRPLSALLFVRKDSPMKSPSDLDGKRIAFVGGRNYCTFLVEAMLEKDQARPRFVLQYAGSTRNVIRAVILGKVDAGASLDLSLEGEPEETRALIRPILATPSTASHALAAHPRVPRPVRSRLAQALLEMARDPADRPLMTAVRLPDPEQADYDRDYRSLERTR